MAIFVRRTDFPRLDDFQKYKVYLRQDFQYVCVYCRVHENELGGPRIFAVEHFRPKKRFPKLITDYTNLLYACAVCNSFKKEDWHDGDPLTCHKGYLDPCDYDYDEYFTHTADHKLEGAIATAQYMIKRLHLNRRQLVKLRHLRAEDKQEFEDFIHLCEEAIARIAIQLEQKNISDDDRIRCERQLEQVRATLTRKLEKWKRRWEPRYNLEDYR